MARKRKPGAGRKPTGPVAKKAAFATRITAETRGAIEAQAAATGHSISQAAEHLLQLGLNAKRDRARDDPERALSYLIDRIADYCFSTAEDGRLCRWNTDPSVFEVFRLALARLLERLRPSGDIDSSLEGPLIGRAPEQQAEYVFRTVWAIISSHQAPGSTAEIERRREQAGLRPYPDNRMAAEVSRASYTMSDVKRALKIGTEEDIKQ